MLLLIGLGIYYLTLRTKRTKSQIAFPNVPIQESFNITQLPKPGNTESIIVDFSKCSPGRDTVYFGFGSTSFVFEGIENNKCIFNYSVEAEMSGYGPYTQCSVPTSLGEKTYKNDFGIKLDELQVYCIKPDKNSWQSSLAPVVTFKVITWSFLVL